MMRSVHLPTFVALFVTNAVSAFTIPPSFATTTITTTITGSSTTGISIAARPKDKGTRLHLFPFDDTSRKRKRRTKKNNPFLDDYKVRKEGGGGEEETYEEALQRAAKDPKAFEEFVLKSKGKTVNGNSNSNSNSNNNNSAGTTAPSKDDDTPTGSNEGGSNGKGASKYVPIEEWDRERKKDEMTWEEKVQHDGRRYGNQFQQNEILRKNLKSW